jgi:hypothetical protein
MLSATEAYSEAYESIVNILTGANLVHGISLTPDQIAATTKVVFWETFQKEDKATKKSMYVIFDIARLEPTQFADGNVVARKVTANITIYSSHRNQISLASSIDDAFTSNKWTFNQTSEKTYDSTVEMFSTEYTIQCLVYE